MLPEFVDIQLHMFWTVEFFFFFSALRTSLSDSKRHVSADLLLTKFHDKERG